MVLIILFLPPCPLPPVPCPLLPCLVRSARQNNVISFPIQSFVDPDPFEELFFPNAIAAKRAIADYLGRALAKLTPEQMAFVNSIVEKTLNKEEVMQQVRDYFNPKSGSSP